MCLKDRFSESRDQGCRKLVDIVRIYSADETSKRKKSCGLNLVVYIDYRSIDARKNKSYSLVLQYSWRIFFEIPLRLSGSQQKHSDIWSDIVSV